MTFGMYYHTTSAEVTFTREEYEVLIPLAKSHYDDTCKEAGMGEESPGRAINGFLAQLKMFPTTDETTTVVWPFCNFDITMKILEQRGNCQFLFKEDEGAAALAICDRLAGEIRQVTRGINAQFELLNPRTPVTPRFTKTEGNTINLDGRELCFSTLMRVNDKGEEDAYGRYSVAPTRHDQLVDRIIYLLNIFGDGGVLDK